MSARLSRRNNDESRPDRATFAPGDYGRVTRHRRDSAVVRSVSEGSVDRPPISADHRKPGRHHHLVVLGV